MITHLAPVGLFTVVLLVVGYSAIEPLTHLINGTFLHLITPQ